MKDGGSVAELKRVIEKHLVTPLSRLMNNDAIACGDKVVILHTKDSKSLDFGLLEGGGDVAEVDRMAQRGENHSQGDAAVFQRRLHHARSSHESGEGLDYFAVTLTCDSNKELGNAMIVMQQDLKRVYELTIVNQFIPMSEAPYIASVTILTTAEMAALIGDKFPKATVVKKGKKA